MHNDAYVFEIAVYRVAPDQWEEDTARRVADYEAQYLESFGDDPPEDARVMAASAARSQERPFNWQYNEVVAWIRLLWDGPGPVIKGYLWKVGKAPDTGVGRRRFARGFVPHPFVGGMPMSKVLEEWFTRDQSDDDIFRQLRSGLMALVANRGELRRRHLDLTIFDRVGTYVRWRDLMGL